RAMLAVHLSSSGRGGESLQMLEDIVNNLSTDPADETLQMVSVLTLLSELYVTANEPAKAEALLQRVTAILERELGKDHPFLAMHLARLAQFNLNMKRIDEGLRLARQCSAVLEATQGKDSLIAGMNLMTLARLHVARGERKEAKEYLERCRRIYTEQMGPNNPVVARALAELAGPRVSGGVYRHDGRELDDPPRN